MPMIDRATNDCVDVRAIDNRSVVFVNVDICFSTGRRGSPGVGCLGVIRVRRIDVADRDDIAVVLSPSAVAYSLAAATNYGNLGSITRPVCANRRTAGKVSQRYAGGQGGCRS